MKTFDFVTDWGLTMTSEQVDENLNNKEWKEANHYLCVIKTRPTANIKSRQYTTYYSMGYGLQGTPKLTELLECLAMDINGLENARNFEDWCAEYGYDTDSRNAEKMFRTIEKQAQDLKNFFKYENAWNAFLSLESE